ncbi:RCC1 domain-containing protein [Caedibacter taeniospiralis]|uniref:RCC1 domain-containing protein n=1 Tax=Caedibacter taeniospiralis TaxID=28907 RepID=UPI000C27B0B3|nr:hypothetical protein [Caedibacter taeniospiralis]
MPISDTTDLEYPLTVTNNGPFTLRTYQGATIGSYLMINGTHEGLSLSYSDADDSCSVKDSLAPGESCTAYIKVAKDAPVTTSAVEVRLLADEVGNNLHENAKASFNTIITSEEFTLVDSDDQPQTRALELYSNPEFKTTIWVKNTGVRSVTLKANALETIDAIGSPGVLLSSNCDGKTLGVGESCAVTLSGNYPANPATVSSWDASYESRLVVNAENASAQNITINTKMVYPWLQVASGNSTTCAIDYRHKLYCWGSGAWGELGDGIGNKSYISTPTAVVAGDQGFTPDNVLSVSVGRQNTCAITDNHQLYCWGNNQYGQLTTSLDVTRQATPQKIKAGSEGFNPDNVISVAIGTGAIYAISQQGDKQSLYYWGVFDVNDDFAMIVKSTPVKLESVGFGEDRFDSDHVKEISVVRDSICAITLSNSLYCWGNQRNAITGTESSTLAYNPVKVPSNLASGFDSSHISSVSLGYNAAYAIDSNHQLYSWGNNMLGALGQGDANTGIHSQATKISDGTEGFTSNRIATLGFSGGDKSQCAIT